MGSLEVPSCPGCTYQWYLNGNPISGANSNTYKPTMAGVYYVVVTTPQGCTFTTPNYISNFGLDDESEFQQLFLYPNPVDDILHIVLGNNMKFSGFKLRDSRGSLVFAQNLMVPENMTISVTQLPAGIYFLELSNSEVTLFRKFVKSKL